MNVSKFSDLKPCRDLIDANFGGYKLSLDALPVYSLNLSAGMLAVTVSSTLSSLSCCYFLARKHKAASRRYWTKVIWPVILFLFYYF